MSRQLDDLGRQHDIADFVGIAISDQLYLPLVSKEKKAVSVRQRFVGFQKADEFLLFLFGQLWHGGFIL